MIEITDDEAIKIKNIDKRIVSLQQVINKKKEKQRLQEDVIAIKRKQVNDQIADEIHFQTEDHYEGMKKNFHRKLFKILAFLVIGSLSCTFMASGMVALLKSISILATFKSFLGAFSIVFFLLSTPMTYYAIKDYNKAFNEPFTVIYPPKIKKGLKNIDEEKKILNEISQEISQNEELLAYLKNEKRKVISFLENYLEQFKQDFALNGFKNTLVKPLIIKKEYPKKEKTYLNYYEDEEYEQTSLFVDDTEVAGQISLFDKEAQRKREIHNIKGGNTWKNRLKML